MHKKNVKKMTIIKWAKTGRGLKFPSSPGPAGNSVPAFSEILQPLTARIFEQVPGLLSVYNPEDIFNIIHEDIRDIINNPKPVFKKNEF